MATPTTTPIDIPLMLGRLAPLGEYHWKGSGYGLYSDIGEWRTPAIPQPTEIAIYAEWDVYLVEKAALDAARAQRVLDYLDMLGTKADTAIANINTELTAIDADAVALAAAGSLAAVKPIVQNMLDRQKANDQRVRGIIKALQHLPDLLG